jgi:hypothetical protein
MSATFHVKNFDRLQHYKDRSPPWIKLYNGLLDDYDFGRLPDACKAHLLAIGLLASRHSNKLPLDADWLGKRINATQPVNLDILIESGFVVPDQPRSNMLAERKQVATPEREGETQVQTETEDTSLRSVSPAPAKAVAVRKPPAGEPDGFAEFYQTYPRHIARAAAAKAYRTALGRAAPEAILDGARRYAATRAGEDQQFTPYPATWLNAGQWTDDINHHKGNGNGSGKLGDARNSRFLQGLGLALAVLSEDGPGEESGGDVVDIGNGRPLLQG